MIETLLGSLLGGAFRLAPEFLKWMDRRGERAHELSMFDRQIAADAQRLAASQQIADTNAAAQVAAAEMAALVAATTAQSQPTGVRWVDSVNALMRPLITFWWVIALYTAALVAQYLALVDRGAATGEAILALWGQEERAIVATIIAFWFVDRSIRHQRK